MSAAQRALAELADAIDAALPQTQCTRCGEPDCRRYAEAIATGHAPINRCPPGGAEGIARLAAITGRTPLPLDPTHGTEGPLRLAVIDEALCIGCTLCIKACPVDCIVGAAKQMHTVIEAQCTGCELCLPACPVDCIALVDAPPSEAGRTAPIAWGAWSTAQATQAAARYRARNQRLDAERRALRVPTAASDASPAPQDGRTTPDAAQARKDRVANALAKAQRRRNA